MKGKLFVCLYSVFLIGLFGVCCYLMTTVNPKKIPAGNETRRFHPGNAIYARVSLPPRDNPDYGLEKIPEGVDADEFRKHYMTKVVKYDFEKEKIPYERGQRVVPPIWPSDDIAEKNVEKAKNKESNPKEFELSSPVKGHRRSINNDKPYDEKESSRSILFKILDDGTHKKIEIKFISDENMKTKMSGKNRSSIQIKSNITNKFIPKVDENTQIKNYDQVIEIKTNDVIILHVVDDPDTVEGRSILPGTNNTDVMQEMVLNITNLKYLNKSLNNKTKLVDLVEANKKVTDPMDYNMYTFSLLFNNENKTIDSRNYSTQEYSSVPSVSTKTLKNVNDVSIFWDAKKKTD